MYNDADSIIFDPALKSYDKFALYEYIKNLARTGAAAYFRNRFDDSYYY